MGPLGGFVIKQVDRLFEGKVRSGFEMLVNDFFRRNRGWFTYLGRLSRDWAGGAGVEQSVGRRGGSDYRSRAAPFGQYVYRAGQGAFPEQRHQSRYFESHRCGTGGESREVRPLLAGVQPAGVGDLARLLDVRKRDGQTVGPGPTIIHFLGGIHEIYFPYILMKPLLILSAIGGGVAGVFTFTLFDAGLVAVPSPGSIFALLAMTPRGGYVGILSGVRLLRPYPF